MQLSHATFSCDRSVMYFYLLGQIGNCRIIMTRKYWKVTSMAVGTIMCESNIPFIMRFGTNDLN